MASIKFTLLKKSNANIYIRFTDGRKIDFKIKSNLVINPIHWNFKDQQLKKSNDVDVINLKAKLYKLETDILKQYNNVSSKDSLNSKWLIDLINPPIKNIDIPTELIKYFNFYVEVKKNDISKSTIKKYNVVKHLLERYQISKGYDLMIKDVNNRFKTEFLNYCIENHYSDGTIQRIFKFVKTICLHAQSNEIKISKQLNDFKYSPPNTKLKPIILTFQELETIESFEYSDSLENVKDWLLISCYTGQRVSDFLRFDISMIKGNKEKPYIEFKQHKTNKLMAVALHSKVIAIINKRNGMFPKPISDQKYNKYIKEVCKIAGLKEVVKGSLKKEIEPKVYRNVVGSYEKWELVASHIGRRSFASNYYGIVPTSILMGTTGHSTERLLLTYIGKSEVDTAMQLHNYF